MLAQSDRSHAATYAWTVRAASALAWASAERRSCHTTVPTPAASTSIDIPTTRATHPRLVAAARKGPPRGSKENVCRRRPRWTRLIACFPRCDQSDRTERPATRPVPYAASGDDRVRSGSDRAAAAPGRMGRTGLPGPPGLRAVVEPRRGLRGHDERPETPPEPAGRGILFGDRRGRRTGGRRRCHPEGAPEVRRAAPGRSSADG